MKKVMMGLAVLCMGASEVAANEEFQTRTHISASQTARPEQLEGAPMTAPQTPVRPSKSLKRRFKEIENERAAKHAEEIIAGRLIIRRARLEEQLGDYDIVPEEDRLRELQDALIAAGLAPNPHENQENETNN